MPGLRPPTTPISAGRLPRPVAALWAGLRRRAAAEDGVVLVLVALLLIVILGMTAIAIDTSDLRSAQSQAQAAADAGALAAAQDLPEDSVSATIDGTSYATHDDPGASVTVIPGVGGDDTKAEVDVTQSVSTLFGQIFGSAQAQVSAKAVAQESYAVDPVDDGNISPDGCADICTFYAPALVASGPWQVVFGNVDLQDCDGGTGDGCTLPDGVTSGEVVDLNGYLPGGIEQTVDTVAGQPYVLSFELTGNPYDDAGDLNYDFTGDVEINSQLTAFSHVNVNGVVTYQLVTVPFDATSNQTTIEFYSTSSRTGDQDYAGPEIADVSLTNPNTNLIQ